MGGVRQEQPWTGALVTTSDSAGQTPWQVCLSDRGIESVKHQPPASISMRVDCRVAVLEPKRGSPQVLAYGSVFFTATLTPARPVWGKLRQGGPATQWMKVPNGCQPATGISGIVRAAATGTAADGTCSTQQLIEGALARDPTRPKDPPSPRLCSPCTLCRASIRPIPSWAAWRAPFLQTLPQRPGMEATDLPSC